ncbi:MAG: FISUMP domain-containing protein [Bacteroidota bacterium]|nr:FISUMP domain-containing protein [Bacteroidota bacterium]
MTSIISSKIRLAILWTGMALFFLFSILACESVEESTPLLMTIDFIEYTSEGTYTITGSIDEVGFNALPGGYRHGSAAFRDVTHTVRFWTSTQNGYGYVWYRELDYDTAAISRDYSEVYRGHSVRCVKDQ